MLDSPQRQGHTRRSRDSQTPPALCCFEEFRNMQIPTRSLVAGTVVSTPSLLLACRHLLTSAFALASNA
jgi:hypothetical protein